MIGWRFPEEGRKREPGTCFAESQALFAKVTGTQKAKVTGTLRAKVTGTQKAKVTGTRGKPKKQVTDTDTGDIIFP